MECMQFLNVLQGFLVDRNDFNFYNRLDFLILDSAEAWSNRLPHTYRSLAVITHNHAASFD